jgi:hypothetical protein
LKDGEGRGKSRRGEEAKKVKVSATEIERYVRGQRS